MLDGITQGEIDTQGNFFPLFNFTNRKNILIKEHLIGSKAGMWVFGIAVKESRTWVGFKLKSKKKPGAKK